MENTGPRRMKKSLERSFDDLLKGLEDESLPDLDDMIYDEAEDLSLTTTVRSTQEGSSHLNNSIPSYNLQIMQSTLPDDNLTLDTKNEDKDEVEGGQLNVYSVNSSEENLDKESLSDHNGFEESDAEMGFQDQLSVHDSESMSDLIDNTEVDIVNNIMEVGEDGNVNNSAYDQNDEEDLDFSVTEDADKLNVEHNKHKTSLMRRGSLANRQKPSRTGRRSSISTDPATMFQDSTEPNARQSSMDSSTDEEELPTPASKLSKKPHGGTGVALPGLHQDLLFTKLKSTPSPAKDKHVKQETFENIGNLTPKKREKETTFDKAGLRAVERKPVEPTPEKQHVFDKPALRNVERQNVKNEMEMEHVFDKLALRKVDPVRTNIDNDQGVTEEGGFDKVALRKTEIPYSTFSNDAFGFEKPALRSVSHEMTPHKSTDRTENEKPVWMTDLILRKTGFNVSRKTEDKESDKPSWYHSASKKRTKIAEFIKSKENQAGDNDDNTNTSAFSSDLQLRSPRSNPLTENGENVRNTKITAESTARRRLDSSERENDINDNTQLKGRDNYVPSWLKATPKVNTTANKFTTNSSDMPQWFIFIV